MAQLKKILYWCMKTRECINEKKVPCPLGMKASLQYTISANNMQNTRENLHLQFCAVLHACIRTSTEASVVRLYKH